MHLRGEKVEIKKDPFWTPFSSSLSLGAKRNNRRVQIYPIWAEREREKCEISVCVQDGAGRLLRLRKKINRPPRSLTKEKNRKGGETPTTPPKKRNKGGQKKKSGSSAEKLFPFFHFSNSLRTRNTRLPGRRNRGAEIKQKKSEQSSSLFARRTTQIAATVKNLKEKR